MFPLSDLLPSLCNVALKVQGWSPSLSDNRRDTLPAVPSLVLTPCVFWPSHVPSIFASHFFFPVVKEGCIFLMTPTSYPPWEKDVAPLTYEQQDLDLTSHAINMNPQENLFLGLEIHLG